MASPSLGQIWGGSGGSAGGAKGGGGTSLSGIWSSANPAPAAASSSGGGHGFLGTIERIPGDFVKNAVPDIENSIIGAGRWLYSGIAPGTHPSFGTLAHEWTNIFRHPVQEFQREKDPFAQGSVALAKGAYTTGRHPARDPFATFLLALPFVKGGVNFGAATRAGLKGETAADAAAKAPGVITARAAEGGAPTVVRVLPRNDPYKAARMKAVDRVLKAVVAPEKPLIGEYARAARSVDRASKVPMLKALADPRLAAYKRSLSKLDEKDRVALNVLARVPLPKDLDAWKGVLRGQDTEVAGHLLDVLSDPKVLERYSEFERFPKIVTAHLAAKALVDANEEIAARTGALGEEAAAAAPYIATRIARGAEYVKPTPARLGRVSTAHRLAQQRVAKLEKLHGHAVLQARRNAAAAILGLKGRLTVKQKDAALAVIEGREPSVPGLIGNKIVTAEAGRTRVTTTTREEPRTPEEAAARLADIEARHNKQVDEMAEMQMGPISPQAEAGRTRTNNAIRRHQTGLTKKGKNRGTISPLARERIKPSLREERRRHVEQQILDAIANDPTLVERVPNVKAFMERMDEIGRLQHALREHGLPEWAREPGAAAPEASALGTRTVTETRTVPGAPGVGRLITPHGGVRAEALGYALSHAREELARIEARAASQIRETGLVGGGTPEEIAAEIRATGQEKPVPEGYVRLYRGEGETRPVSADERDFYGQGNDVGGWFSAERFIAERYAARNNGRVFYLDVPKAVAQAWRVAKENDAGEKWSEYRFPSNTFADMLAQKLPVEELHSGGRPQPIKLPDRPMSEEQINDGSGTGSGRSVPRSPIHESHGTLFRIGMIDLVHDRLTAHYLANARYEAKILKHDLAMKAAAPVEEGAGRPPGTEWLRTRKGERIPYLEDVKAEHLAELDRVLPRGEEHPFTVTEAELKDNPELVARNAQGQRLVVSKQFADGLEHAYRNEDTALNRFVSRPLDVWRALVLNLRVPWLLNNIVGNNLLYALRFAGYGGLRAYLNMIRDIHGPRAVRLLLGDRSTRLTLSQDDIREITPAQDRGTFIGTSLPEGAVARTRVGRKAVKAARFLNAGLAPLDRRTEAFLRRGGVNAVLRSSPEAKRIYKAMDPQTRSWRDAMMQAGRENPQLLEHVNREVNDALGDYLSLSPVERGALRRAVPFYGWYREITRIAAHTILDRPLRAAILAQLGQLEAERQQDERGAFPSFLQGSFALGPGPMGTERVLALRSANPLSTIVDLGRAASTLAHPTNRANASALLGIVNPFAEASGATLFGSARGDVADQGYQGGAADWLSKHLGLPGQVVGSVFGGLPQAQIFFPPPPSRLYPTRSREDIFWRWLGDVRRNPSLQQAHYYASQGR